MLSDFYKTKKLCDMSDEEWESLCDGCGLCCYRKFVTGYGKREKIHLTRIACDLLDLKTGKCSDYCNRFLKIKECVHLTKKNVSKFDWLPKTCAYRLLHLNQSLPPWHPLVSGSSESVKKSGIMIKNGIHESDIGNSDWEDFELGIL